MPAFDEFTATVGVTLIERAGCLPWTAPAPPQLAGARGWYVPGPAGPHVAFVVRAPEDAAAVVAAWRAWLAGVRADEGILLLVGEGGAEPPAELEDHPRWQAWWADLDERRLVRLGPPAPDDADPEPPPAGSFAGAVDGAALAYFDGPHLTLADLSEEERARLAGKAPFLAFLDAQPAPASAVLLGLVGGFYLITSLVAVPDPLSAAKLWWKAVLEASPVALLKLGATLRPLVAQGEAWRLVAANYLHGNLLHLFVNVYSLAVMGPPLEKIFGTPKFLAIWTIAGVTGALASVLWNPNALSVGASGALFGLLGAMFALGARFRGAIPAHQIRTIRHIALIALGINLILGFTTPKVDNMAHLGGLVGGFAVAFVIGPHPALIGRPTRPWVLRALWAVPLVGLMALATGLAAAATGRVPAVPVDGPAHDFEVRLPIDAQIERINQYLIVRHDRADRYVLVHSVPNPEGRPEPGRALLTEDTLGARVYDVARRYASQGARLVDRPGMVTGGHHRFLLIPVAMPEGTREEIYVTASPARVYAVRTRGLAADPWVAKTRDQVLATFTMRRP